MKKLIILLFIPIVFACSDDEKNSMTRNNLNGNVKSTKEIYFEAIEKFGKITKGSRFGYQFLQTYDNEGNSIERSVYNKDDDLLHKYIYVYDSEGRSIEQNRYNSDGDLEEKWTSQFDDNDNEIKSSLYNSDGDLQNKYSFKYNNEGILIEMKMFRNDGKLERTYTYEVDDEGNTIKEVINSSDGNILDKWTYNYEFDIKDNWIRRTQFIDKKPINITEREIEYYD
tara:strand:- start:306 stop:983 length:678 start_codon:yes stop_codon:yes gene_type:complete